MELKQINVRIDLDLYEKVRQYGNRFDLSFRKALCGLLRASDDTKYLARGCAPKTNSRKFVEEEEDDTVYYDDDEEKPFFEQSIIDKHREMAIARATGFERIEDTVMELSRYFDEQIAKYPNQERARKALEDIREEIFLDWGISVE